MMHQGTVASRSASDGLHPAALLFGHLHHVELAAPVGLAEPAELSHCIARALKQLGMGVHQPLRSRVSAGLLVGDQRQDHVARQAGILQVGAHVGVHHHGDAALHIQRAPTPYVAVLQPAFKRWYVPGLCRRGHHVDVSVHQQGRRVPASFQATDHVDAVGVVAHQLGGDADAVQNVPAVRGAFALVARRIRRVVPDQCPQQFRYVGSAANRRFPETHTAKPSDAGQPAVGIIAGVRVVSRAGVTHVAQIHVQAL